MATRKNAPVGASRRERTLATRRQLLDAAAKIFAANGYDATSVADIVAAAGVSVGTFYHHFSSKNALFEALWDELNATLYNAVMAAQESARAAVRIARDEGVADDLELFETGAYAYFISMWNERETARTFYFGDLPAQFADARRKATYSWVAENSTFLRKPDSPTDRIVNRLVAVAVTESLAEILQSSDEAEAEHTIRDAIRIVAAIDRVGSPSSPIGQRI